MIIDKPIIAATTLAIPRASLQADQKNIDYSKT
jgi:hypothetical protein